jgi:hypothetical protein
VRKLLKTKDREWKKTVQESKKMQKSAQAIEMFSVTKGKPAGDDGLFELTGA